MLLRDGAVMVTAMPSRTRRLPYTQVFGADHYSAGRRVRVEVHDRRSFAANPGSLLVVQDRGRRHRTPSASKIRRTWERCTSIPAPRAAPARVSSVHTAACSSPAAARPSSHGPVTGRPGGVVLT